MFIKFCNSKTNEDTCIKMSIQGNCGKICSHPFWMVLLCPLYCNGAYREFVRPSIRLLIQSKNVNESKSANFLSNIEAVSESDMLGET